MKVGRRITDHPRHLHARIPPAASANGAPTSSSNGHGSSGGPLLPCIIVSNRPLRDVSNDGFAAIVNTNDPPMILERGGELVRVRMDEKEHPRIDPLTEAALRGHLARAATFFRLTPHGTAAHIPPPLDVVRDLFALSDWPGIPPLTGLIEAPTLRSDGSILQDPGYDAATGLYYAPAPGLVVPPIVDRPTRRDLDWAADIVDDALDGFVFVDAASRANAIAALFTPIVRPGILGQTPLFVFDAPAKGTGKSALAELIDIVATRGHSGVLPETEDDAEWRKRYTSLLREGVTLAILDDVRRRLESPVLAMMVTAPRWRDRTLGTNTSGLYDNTVVLIACGNNIALGGDLGRRVVWVRMDTKLAQPWRRSNFARSDLPGWARENRGQVIAAVLTLARAWWAAGCPEVSVPAFAGFGSWVRVLGGVLEIAGVEGFLGNLDAMAEQADEDEAAVEAFLRAWQRAFRDAPVRTAQVAAAAIGDGELRDALPGFLAELADERGQHKLAHRLGNLLRRKVDTRYGTDGIRVERAGEDGHRKVGVWRVVTDEPAPTSCEAADEVPAEPQGSSSAEPAITPISQQNLPEVLTRLAGEARGRLTVLVRAAGYPRLEIGPGNTVPAGTVPWVQFIAHATDDQLAQAEQALRARNQGAW